MRPYVWLPSNKKGPVFSRRVRRETGGGLRQWGGRWRRPLPEMEERNRVLVDDGQSPLQFCGAIEIGPKESER